MTTKYFALLTSQGAAKLANAAALGTKLQITQMAVGDGGGTLPTPDTAQTKLISEWRREALNSLSIDAANSSQIIAEQVIPESEGGFWIREIGLYDADGDLIAVANCPETYKPKLAEGSGRTQTVRMILIVNSTSAVTLKVDPSVVLATRKYADDKAAEAKTYTDSKVIEVKAYADDKMAKHLAASDPHTQYAPKNSPELTGIPKAPTASVGDNSTQLANTAFVSAAIAALTGAAPETLDTLKELADSLGNDPHFSATVLNALAGKMDKAKNGSDIPNVAAFVANLGLGAAAKLPAATATTGDNLIVNIPLYVTGGSLKYLTIQMFSIAGTGLGNSIWLTFTHPVAYSSVPFGIVSGVVGQTSAAGSDEGAEIWSLTATGGQVYSAWGSRSSTEKEIRLMIVGIRDNV